MIVNQHPVLKLLDDFPWIVHLIGSRYVGKFDRDKSDYDFILECSHTEWRQEVKKWLSDNGFKIVGTSGYGPDRDLHGSNIWTWKDKSSNFPSVDIFPMTKEESEFRLNFFRAMKKNGDKTGGLLALALKKEQAWSNLWKCLRRFEVEKNDA